MDLERLQTEYPSVDVQRDTKFVDAGNIITSGGISPGIHMSWYLVARLLGEDVAKQTARRMEYDMSWE